MNDLIEFFKTMGKNIAQLKMYFGKPKATIEYNTNPYGDTTIYIDKKAQEIVLNMIIKQGLKCTLVSEETEITNLGSKLPILVVDPIDGSLNAKSGVAYSAFSICLAISNHTDSIESAYILNLATNDEFYAVKSKGSYFNNLPIQKISLKESVIAIEGIKRQTDICKLRQIFESFYRVRSMGSVALDMCYVALGSFDAFFHLQPSRVIDYAAGKLIIEESGGGLYVFGTKQSFVAPINLEKDKSFYAISKKENLQTLFDKIFTEGTV